MLAELAAFNAGFAVIKQTVLNGKDITSALGSLSNMLGAEEDLKARANPKKRNIWTKVAGKSADDFEEFIALNSIKEQRKELESMVRMISSLTKRRCARSAKRKLKNVNVQLLDWLGLLSGA